MRNCETDITEVKNTISGLKSTPEGFNSEAKKGSATYKQKAPKQSGKEREKKANVAKW